MTLIILPIEKWLFTPLCLGILLAFFSILGFIIFVKCFPLSDSTWKKSEIILLFCSVLGIGGLVGSNRRLFYEREQMSIGYRIDRYINDFNRELDTAMYNRSFSSTLYSSQNIHEAENEYGNIYTWVLKNKPQFIQKVCERNTIDCDSIAFPVISENFLLQDVARWKSLISEYNRLVDEYQYFSNNKEENTFEFYYNILYPLFFVLGLSYSIVRFVGECHNIKKRNKSSK